MTRRTGESGAWLVATGIGKSYGPTRALDGVDFALERGEVHALVGENGAGKSTLSRILCGLTPPDEGALTIGGRPYRPRSKRDADDLGVRMVSQELTLIPTLTIAESISLERLPHRWGWIDRKRLLERARNALEVVGLAGLDPERRVGDLGVGQQQLVEIAAGLSRRCEALILDEPTAALSAAEVDRLFARLEELKAAGAGIVYISHRLEELLRIADRVSVLRDGRRVATGRADELPHRELIRLMVGRDLDEPARCRRGPRRPGSTLLRAVGLRRRPTVQGVSFELCRGEVLGLAGLMGSGRTETLRLVFGADVADGGQLWIGDDGEPTPPRSPREAALRGVALLTENRKEEGLLLPLAVSDNITLACLRRFGSRGGWIRREAEARAAADWVQRLRIRCHATDQPVRDLSGGNQQKVLIARWLLREPDILLFDEPTRGIDVGARHEVHRLLGELADRGKGIVVASSDLEELLEVADRIAVLSAGRLVATFQRGEWSRDGILAAALAGRDRESA